jgi:hypothetical protein
MTNVAKHQDLAQAEPLPSDAPDEPVRRTGEKLKIKAAIEGETYIFPLVARVLLVAAFAMFAHFILALTSIISLISALVIVTACDHFGYAVKTIQNVNDWACRLKKK